MDKDVVALIQALIKKTYVSLMDLEIETNATRRQVNYRLEKVNVFLKNQGFLAVQIGSEKEVIIPSETRGYLIRFIHEVRSNDSYYLSKTERRAYIFLMLFINEEYIKLCHIVDSLNVSRSTVLLDIKDLNIELNNLEIEIKYNRVNGYYLCGSEMKIRSYMMQLIIFSLADQRNARVFDLFIEDHQLDIFEYSKLVIAELAEKHHISFVEDRLVEFIYIFIFLKARIISGKDAREEIEVMPAVDMMKSLKEYIFTKELLTHYKNADEIPDLEINYISSWILGISVGNVEDDGSDCLVIGELVGKIMTRFEFLSGVHYKDGEEIFRQLFSHFKPAYYRMLFKLPIFNPLRQRVKDEYNSLYSLVNETMKPFAILFGEDIPDDELAYLTIHFATIYSRGREESALEKKWALIVCSNGIGSSAILYNELRGMFPELNFYLPIEVSKYQYYNQPVDIVFTTQLLSKLHHINVPIIKVSPLMEMRERYEVTREVYTCLGMSLINQPSIENIMAVIKKHVVVENEELLYAELLTCLTAKDSKNEVIKDKGYSLIEMTDESLVELNIEASNWEEAIRIAGSKLVDNNKITQNYVDEIIRINKLTTPYIVIAKHVALPHAKPTCGALECAIGFATLKNPISFNSENDPVKYIFFLSALDNKQHLLAMTELLELMNMPEFYKMLDDAKDSKEVINYLKKFENNYFRN